jgi:cytidine deaminase
MLVKTALEARNASYCPYSHFAVGAALLCADGSVFTGANIECASHTPTICAERVAFSRAVHEGKRDFVAIAVVGGGKDEPIAFVCPPCGVCRQVMTEFCDDAFQIILFDGKTTKIHTLGELFPLRFGL